MRYITIDDDRYGGAYSGAPYTAWDGDAPDDIDAGDVTCQLFWESSRRVYGKGNSPQEALIDLVRKFGVWVLNWQVIHKNGGTGPSSVLVIGTDAFWHFMRSQEEGDIQSTIVSDPNFERQ
jgi:hypothetical protein